MTIESLALLFKRPKFKPAYIFLAEMPKKREIMNNYTDETIKQIVSKRSFNNSCIQVNTRDQFVVDAHKWHMNKKTGTWSIR